MVTLIPVMVEPLDDQFAVGTGSVAPDVGVVGELPPRDAVGWLINEPPLLKVTVDICAPVLKVVVKEHALAPLPILNVPDPVV